MSSAQADPTDSFLVKLVTNPVTTWWIRTIASPLDPILMRLTNGRFATMGPVGDTMITLTMTGRRSGKPRSVQLTSMEHGGDRLVVASAMGAQKHPAWRYNLEANPEIEVQAAGERYRARAELLSDEEKAAIWDDFCDQVPICLLYTSPSPRDKRQSRMPSSA